MIRRIRQTLEDVGLATNEHAAFKNELLRKRIIRTIWDGDLENKGIGILEEARLETHTAGFTSSQASTPIPYSFTTALQTSLPPRTTIKEPPTQQRQITTTSRIQHPTTNQLQQIQQTHQAEVTQKGPTGNEQRESIQEQQTCKNLPSSMAQNPYTTQDSRQLPAARTHANAENLQNEEAARRYSATFPVMYQQAQRAIQAQDLYIPTFPNNPPTTPFVMSVF